MSARVDPILQEIRDQRIARGFSLAVHGLLFAWLAWHVTPVVKSNLVIFSVEAVSGITPLGQGSGAEGASQQMSDIPANANPLAGGLNLKVSDAPVPAQPKAPVKAAAQAKPVASVPSLEDVQKQHESLPIGLKPRHSEGAEEPSEGGMGNGLKAGTEGGLDMQGAIAGRKYYPGDYSYGKPLPGESEVMILVVVNPKGEVVLASVKRTSGYPDLDMHALSKARDIKFEALPPGVAQENAAGTVPFRFEYTGRSKL